MQNGNFSMAFSILIILIVQHSGINHCNNDFTVCPSSAHGHSICVSFVTDFHAQS